MEQSRGRVATVIAPGGWKRNLRGKAIHFWKECAHTHRASGLGSALPAPWLAVALAKVAERQSEWAPSLARRSPGGGGACWFRRPRRNRLPGKFAIARARSL